MSTIDKSLVGYLVNIPYFFRGDSKENVDTTVHAIVSILTQYPIFKEDKNIKLVLGLNQERGTAVQSIAVEGVRKVEQVVKRLKLERRILFDVAVENYEWDPLPEPSPSKSYTNYSDIRNRLFFLKSNKQFIHEFKSGGVRDIIYVTMDPDTKLRGDQLSRVESAITESDIPHSPLVVAGHYEFEVSDSELIPSGGSSNGFLRWSPFLISLMTKYDGMLKRSIAEETFVVVTKRHDGSSVTHEVPGSYILYPPEPILFVSLFKKLDNGREIDLYDELVKQKNHPPHITPWGKNRYTGEGQVLVTNISKVWRNYTRSLPSKYRARELIEFSVDYATQVPPRVYQSLANGHGLPPTIEKLKVMYSTRQEALKLALRERFSLVTQGSLGPKFIEQRRSYIGVDEGDGYFRPGPIDPKIRGEIFDAFLSYYTRQKAIIMDALVWETLQEIEKAIQQAKPPQKSFAEAISAQRVTPRGCYP